MMTTLVGIVPGTQADSLSFGIVDAERQAVFSETFQLSQSSIDELMQMTVQSLPPDLMAIKDFLDEHIHDREDTRCLIEAPLQPQEAGNKFFRVLLGLTTCGYTNFAMGISQDKQQTIIHRAMPQIPPQGTSKTQHERMKARQALLLPSRMGETYYHFLAGSCPSTEHAALGAALIGRNMTLYHYLVLYQYGNEPSSGDLATFFTFSEMLRQASQEKDMKMAGQYLPQSVMSKAASGKNQVITWADSKAIVTENIDKIPMEYAVATKRYEYLGAMNAQKFGVMTVCTKWGLRLTYGFDEAESPLGAEAQPRLPIIDPDDESEAWLIDALQHSVPQETNKPSSHPAKAKPTTQKATSQPQRPMLIADKGGNNIFSRLLSRFRK